MTTNAARSTGANRRPTRGFGWTIAIVTGLVAFTGILFLLLPGKKKPNSTTLVTAYGARNRGDEKEASIYGVSIFAEMLESAGHKVMVRRRLSRKSLSGVDVIIWIPDSYGLPNGRAESFINEWLDRQPNRRFVFVGRDYDAATELWSVARSADATQKREGSAFPYARAILTQESRRTRALENQSSSWFTIRTDYPIRELPDLDGPWAQGVDPAKAALTIGIRLDLPTETRSRGGAAIDPKSAEVLLQSENDLLAFRLKKTFNRNEILVVNDGSFLLNLGLANKERRKLAGRLISELPPKSTIALVESDEFGPTVYSGRKGESEEDAGIGITILKVWPFNLIVIQLCLLGLAYCISRFPIFGTPRGLPKEERADFGRHIVALGKLLARTKDANFAQERITKYHEHAKRSSGASHLSRR